jgi:hypothetical protein
MSNTKKKRISLWKSTSKAGNVYLSGSDKENNIKYFVFKDKKDADVRSLLSKPIGDNDAKFTQVETLSIKQMDGKDPFFTGGDYLLGTNNYYYEDDQDAHKGGVRYLTRKDGSTVIGRDGEPLEKNSHVLLIGK